MFNIRVYGILINENNQVLVSDELIRGKKITKFCGGGLEFGEGTRDCLRREFMEEMNLKVDIKEHIYTTDFFQESAFNPAHQIISIYYRVEPIEPIKARITKGPFDFDAESLRIYEITQQAESFRFIDKSEFSDACMTLPIDKIVAKMIVELIK